MEQFSVDSAGENHWLIDRAPAHKALTNEGSIALLFISSHAGTRLKKVKALLRCSSLSASGGQVDVGGVRRGTDRQTPAGLNTVFRWCTYMYIRPHVVLLHAAVVVFLSSHVSGVAQVLSGLRGALVGAGLESDVGVAHAPDLLLAEVALVLLGDLGADLRTVVLRVQLGLLAHARERKKSSKVWRATTVIYRHLLTILPSALRQSVTCAMFLRSKRSAVWKISSSGTPYLRMAA